MIHPLVPKGVPSDSTDKKFCTLGSNSYSSMAILGM
jgi:hypothetical protein